MFKVVNANGHVLTVYAVSGSLLLTWNDSTEDAHWEWVPMDQCQPLMSGEDAIR